MEAPGAPVETAEERRKRQMDGVPNLPPLLAQILAETRAKQQRQKDRLAQGLPPEEEDDKKASKAGGGLPGGPLLLEAPPSAHLVIATHDAPIPKELSDSEESGDEGEADAPPGPPDAARCRAHGPGFSGGAAQQQVKLTITARDAAGKRVREGGAHILVMVEPTAPPGAAGEEEQEAIEAEVQDHGNGSYTASYSVPKKGNYQLHIEVNSEPLGGSPFPIFFSAPVAQPAGAAGGQQPPAPVAGEASDAAVIAAMAPLASGGAILTADAIKAASQQAGAAAGAALAGALAGAEAAALGMPAALPANLQNSLARLCPGIQMAQLGMKFPPTLTDEQANRMVVVAGVPAIATVEALKSVFGFCGTIRTCSLAGGNSGFAFLEFAAPHEAAAALAMSGTALMGSALRLELASVSKKAADAVAVSVQVNNPYMALQLQQVQQFQLLQQQQTALAQQVVAMRAAQRTGVMPAPLPAKPHDSDSQKSAAIAAAIALSKKLAGGGGAAAAAAAAPDANNSERTRSRSRSRDRSRRERRRSRSRSRDRRGSRRSRSRDRRVSRRSRSRDRRSGRGGSRERRPRRSRSRENKERHKHKHRHHRKDRHRSRSRDDKERDGRGRRDKEEAAGGVEKMDVDVPPSEAPAGQEAGKAQPVDELEALLDELDD